MNHRLTVATFVLASGPLVLGYGGEVAAVGVELYRLPAPDLEPGAFAASLAIDDGQVAIGRFIDNDDDSDGAVYLFDVASGSLQQQLSPTAGNPIGNSVGLDDGVVVAGDYYDDGLGFGTGAAFLFDAATGAQTNELTPDDASGFSFFGVSVAIDDGVAAIAAPEADGFYLFDVAAGDQILKADTDQHTYASEVAIDGDYVAVAGQGEAAVVDATDGELLHELDLAGTRFGEVIASNDGMVIAGANRNEHAGANSGAVYVFDAATGQQIVRLVADDAQAGDFFGTSVAIDNGIAIVGASGEDSAADNGGAAYLFDVITGEQIAKLTGSDIGAGSRFGSSVAIGEGYAVVGAAGHDGGRGAAYVFATMVIPEPTTVLLASLVVLLSSARAQGRR